MAAYGRNRQSIADIEQELYNVFREHPAVTYNNEDEPVVSGDSLVDILRTFSRNHDAELLDPHEEEMLNHLVTTNPGLDVTPQILLQFIAMRTTNPPTTPARDSPDGSSSPDSDIEYEEEERGRYIDYDGGDGNERGHSRSSSRDSVQTSMYYPGPGSRPPSRPPSRGPPVPPKTPTHDSPFDTSRRQRGPKNLPSSYRRPVPPTRRKSDASQHGRASSDSESMTSPPSAFGRGGGGRSRAPSNPTSPSTSFSTFSPPSRPHSRAQSQPQNNFASFGSSDREYDYDHDQTMTSSSMTSNGRSNSRMGMISPPPSDISFDGLDSSELFDRISSLQMPKKDGDDEDEVPSDEERRRGLIEAPRSVVSSTTSSIDMQDRVEALQKLNMDLGKKLLEAENTLQNRLSEHESELEELHSKLEAAKNELSATKREEKELRAKERTNSTQILALESEISKLQKSLENARTSYQSLQKQYQEQCHESERYRDLLRRRDEEIKVIKEQTDMTALEAQKLASVAATYEAQIEALHQELESAQQAVSALDEQKQENMFLKETIDRMRYDMDEMRTSSGGGPGSGAASIRGSVSKSLGAELLGKMKWQSEEDVEYVTSDPEDRLSDEEEEEIEEIVGGDETESEDVIQTIITRTKRKVGSRARKIETFNINEVKEYSDAAIQHDISEFTHSMNVQTDPEPKPITRTFSIQTEERSLASMDIQTDPELVSEPVLRVEMDIQTEPEPEPEVEEEEEEEEEEPVSSTSSTPPSETDETLASSSSTLIPPTPKAEHPHDLPPAYNQVQDDLAVRVANETLKTWHKGLKLPIEPIPGGISDDAIEEWKSLKEELGIECGAIDKIVAESTRTGVPRPSKDGRQPRRRSRFYNIYNTYVYGGGDKEGSSSLSLLSSSQFLFCLGASAAVAFIVGHSTAPQYHIPGGATYYDRAAWASYNTFQAAGEGFPGDGTSALWGFLGRLGGGAARSLRGWPT